MIRSTHNHHLPLYASKLGQKCCKQNPTTCLRISFLLTCTALGLPIYIVPAMFFHVITGAMNGSRLSSNHSRPTPSPPSAQTPSLLLHLIFASSSPRTSSSLPFMVAAHLSISSGTPLPFPVFSQVYDSSNSSSFPLLCISCRSPSSNSIITRHSQLHHLDHLHRHSLLSTGDNISSHCWVLHLYQDHRHHFLNFEPSDLRSRLYPCFLSSPATQWYI